MTIRTRGLRAAKRAGVALGAAAAVLVPTIGMAPDASADVLNLCNTGTTGIGVMHFHDGTYSRGKYDTVLAPNTCTSRLGWGSASGFYIGSGFVVDVYNTGNPIAVTFGPGQHFPFTTYHGTVRMRARR